MSLHARLRLFLGLVLLALFAANSLNSYRSAQQELERSTLKQAENIRSVLMSVRRIYHQQFLASGIELTSETLGFLPAHAMNRVSKDLPFWAGESFTFNNVSDKPRNMTQAADSLEAIIIDHFRANPDQEVYFEPYVSKTGDPVYQYARPIWIEEYCLKCHGPQESSPPTIQTTYKTAFEYKVGELRGLMSIRIPIQATQAQMVAQQKSNLLVNLLLFLVSFVALSFLIRKFVHEPISQLNRIVNQVASGDQGMRMPKLSHEFSGLTESINQMAQTIDDDRVKLQAKEKTYRSLVEGTRAAGWTMDLDSRKFTFLGPQLQHMLGYDLDQWSDFDFWLSIISEQDRDRIAGLYEDVFASGENLSLEYRMVTSSGDEIWVKDLANANRSQNKNEIVGFLVDISEQKESENQRLSLERQVQQVQKLESLGVLAGGIAHDFNNLLSGILGHADLALMEISPQSPACNDIQAVITASRRAADLSKQMLAYSGKGKFILENIHLGHLVNEMIDLLQVSLNKNASLRFQEQEALSLIEGDPTQIRQVVMNLITNAAEAISGPSGIVSLKVDQMECDQDYFTSPGFVSVGIDPEEFPAGHYVFLEVTDTGSGMDQETMAKIFDPFFTSKFTGRGLGLAATLGIIRGHQGSIKVYSEVGKGTTFKVLFPALDQSAILANEEKQPAAESWTSSGTILVVDDEKAIRQICQRMLKLLGFSVLTADSGKAALEIYEENRDEIVCVLLDVTMPEMDGKEVFQRITRVNPAVPIVMSSGYNQQDISQEFIGRKLAGFLQKPYQLSQLKSVLREILKN